ncbi:MAG: SUMF1/EgtB/PvdO family nonheme iron enzyme, partial [Chloroflexota bacterium]
RETMLAGRNLKEGDDDAPALGGLQPVLELLKKHAGLIVLGDPGSGKTTFLKYLALRLASGTGQALELGDRLPILVPISAYANALDKNRNIRLDDFIVEYLHANGSNLPVAEMLKQAFQRGTALILLDGLDEVAKLSQRTQVVSRIVDFYAFHKPAGNKFVITSRIVGYREVRPAVEDLVEGTLADFDDDQIQLFLEHWSLTLEKQVYGDTDLARMNAQREKFVLWTAIQRNAGVRALASNPLLLTILALIKRQGVTLPERRVELYDLSLRTLLSTWNRARNIGGLSPGRDVDERQTIQVLAPLALWMHQTNIGVGLVRRRDLERQLQSLFEKRGDDPQHASELFMQDVHDFTGVLLERGPDEYGFIHLTFEEYLSAIAIAQKGQLDWKVIYDTLSKKIGDPAWHEISMLTIGYVGLIKGDDQVVGHIIDALLIEQPGEPGQAVLFAGEAVLDTQPRGVPPKIRQTVVDALVSTMQNSNVKPVFRRQAGLILGELGWTPDDLDTFVEIAPGKFLMGSNKDDPQAYDDEKPQREVAIKQRYWIAKYPVSNLQYARFIKAGGYENNDWWSKAGWDWRAGKGRLQPDYWDDREFANPLFPVVGVTWFEAQAYCAWSNTQSSDFVIPGGYCVRLPTEAEWERAARFSDGREYPWNAAFDPKFTNTVESDLKATTAVCTYPLGKSQENVWDLSGNVWEWSADWFEKGKYRSLRGGSWFSYCWYARCAYRLRNFPDYFDDFIGFRCVVSLAIPES